ncbi:tyrosine-type recombinase/integrase [Paenibacillus durus]|uniref:hypothetical protein n=1 Tax=Paenibacillus durus TaxID=44251 RepID=UPI000B0E7A2F|nr:hypothetical protein [Paenibacillus durus]
MNYKDENGKRKNKWIATGLPVKGNKKKAEGMLLDARRNFELPSEAVEEEKVEEILLGGAEETEENDILFADFMLEWLEMMKYQVEVTTHAAYSFAVKTRIVPYFREKRIFLKEHQSICTTSTSMY